MYLNTINNKIYVGQTNNPTRRQREHKSNSFNASSVCYNHLLHKAIRKYGYENFKFSILEEIDSNVQREIDEKERYWINKKDSLFNQNGYNLLIGGQSRYYFSSLSSSDVANIKDLISKGTSYTEIQKIYPYSKTFISGINAGLYFFDESQKYPIYAYRLSNETLKELIDLLEEEELTFKEIALALGIGESTVKKINYGTLRPGLSNEYPIRKNTPSNKKADLVKELLLNTSYSRQQILHISGVSEETLRRINKGITRKDKDLAYPLRNFVETIPS